jgi:hypothetical protein
LHLSSRYQATGTTMYMAVERAKTRSSASETTYSVLKGDGLCGQRWPRPGVDRCEVGDSTEGACRWSPTPQPLDRRSPTGRRPSPCRQRWRAFLRESSPHLGPERHRSTAWKGPWLGTGERSQGFSVLSGGHRSPVRRSSSQNAKYSASVVAIRTILPASAESSAL